MERNLLRELRRRTGMTQEVLAMVMGTSRSLVALVETGRARLIASHVANLRMMGFLREE